MLTRIIDGPWSDTEHEDFLIGLQECGSGQWRMIADKYVKTRTRTQVASHAQVLTFIRII
jgi:SHAQKYF class myb-like DNA-binding protein